MNLNLKFPISAICAPAEIARVVFGGLTTGLAGADTEAASG